MFRCPVPFPVRVSVSLCFLIRSVRITRTQMESIQVVTIAGSGEVSCVDGIGTAASIFGAEGICYVESSGALLIAETTAHRIQCL